MCDDNGDGSVAAPGDDDDDVTTEVQGTVEENTTTTVAAPTAAQLAITGSYNVLSFVLIAFGMLLLGASFTLASSKPELA